MNTLTHRQKLQIFFSYFGCKYTYTSESAGDFTCEVSGLNLAISSHVSQGAKLHLTPISAITDEAAIEVEFCPPSNFGKYQKEILSITRYHDGFNIDWRYVDTITELNNKDGWSYTGNKTYFHSITWQQRDYLLSKGYAVPLFIAPNHPDNGKTAIELGIAIDKTTL